MSFYANIYISAPYTLEDRLDRLHEVSNELQKTNEDLNITWTNPTDNYNVDDLLTADILLVLTSEAEYITIGVASEVEKAMSLGVPVIQVFQDLHSLYSVKSIESLGGTNSSVYPFTHSLICGAFLGGTGVPSAFTVIDEYYELFHFNKENDRSKSKPIESPSEYVERLIGVPTWQTTSSSPNLKLIASIL